MWCCVVARFHVAFHALVHGWEWLQIELHGQYSLTRFDELIAFTRQTSTCRAIAILLLTPAASVIAMLLLDALPLRPPSDGVFNQSASFWVRMVALGSLMCSIAIIEVQFASSRLPLVNYGQLVLAGSLGGTSLTALTFVLGVCIGFPTPFVLQLTEMPGMMLVFHLLRPIWKEPLREDSVVQRDLRQFLWFVGCVDVMLVLYPVLLLVFGMLNGLHQSLFAICFPILKLFLKNWASHGMYRREDLTPVYVVFSVDVFHTLLLACTMQSAVSSGTLITIMSTDVFQSVVAVVEVRSIVKQLKRLQFEILSTTGEATAFMNRWRDNTNVLSFASAVLESEPDIRGDPVVAFARHKRRHIRPSPEPLVLQSMIPSRVVPEQPVLHDTDKRAQQVEYVQLSLKLLHMVEFYMLIEFTEVVVALLYAVFLIAMFHLPNRAYYMTLKTLTHDQLTGTVANVLQFAGLELLSLVALGVVLNRLLGLSTLRLLAFTLDKHALLAQALLVLWVSMATQLTLEHLGNDYTFRFEWLRHSKLG